VTQDNSFFIYDSVRNIHSHYKMNIYEFPEYQVKFLFYIILIIQILNGYIVINV